MGPAPPSAPTPAPPGAPSGLSGSSGSLIGGPRWYRSRIRALGPFVALIPPAIVGIGGAALLRIGDSRPTGIAGLVTGLWAAPGLLVLGAPLSDTDLHPFGIGLSIVVWLLIGFVASRRATRDPMADWWQYWRHYLWAAAGILLGVVAALVVVGVVFREALL